MRLSAIQGMANAWEKKNFPNRKPYQSILGALEELGELAHAHLKQEEGIRTDEDHDANARDAVGDIVVYLISYCNQRGWSLAEILDETWAEVEKRDWTKRKDIPKDTKFVDAGHQP